MYKPQLTEEKKGEITLALQRKGINLDQLTSPMEIFKAAEKAGVDALDILKLQSDLSVERIQQRLEEQEQK